MQAKNGEGYDNQIATTSQRSFPFGVIVQASIVEKTQCLLPFCASFTCLSPEKISWVGLDDPNPCDIAKHAICESKFTLP